MSSLKTVRDHPAECLWPQVRGSSRSRALGFGQQVKGVGVWAAGQGRWGLGSRSRALGFGQQVKGVGVWAAS